MHPFLRSGFRPFLLGISIPSHPFFFEFPFTIITMLRYLPTKDNPHIPSTQWTIHYLTTASPARIILPVRLSFSHTSIVIFPFIFFHTTNCNLYSLKQKLQNPCISIILVSTLNRMYFQLMVKSDMLSFLLAHTGHCSFLKYLEFNVFAVFTLSPFFLVHPIFYIDY